HVFGSASCARRGAFCAQLSQELGEHVLPLPSAPGAASPEPGAGHCS
ncbi:hypothetical protein A2U01_0092076, partial [Trifolium medium]|nr:hypothetical protein [Trifolium medium]